MAPKQVVTTGDVLREQVIGSKSWVHRKVQRYDHTKPGSVSVQTVLDVTPKRGSIKSASSKHVVLPVALLTKGALLSFEISLLNSHPLAVLRSEETSVYTRLLMENIIERGNLSIRPPSDKANAWSFIDCKPQDADEAFEVFRKHLSIPTVPRQKEGLLAQDVELVLQMARSLSTYRLLLIEFPTSLLGQRSLVSYVYDLELTANTRVNLEISDKYRLDVEDPGYAASLHLEVVMPAEMVVDSIFLEFRLPRGTYRKAIPSEDSARRIAHVYTREIPRFSEAMLQFAIRPVSTGLKNFTRISASIVVLLSVFVAFVRYGPSYEFLVPGWAESNSVAVILVGPAILLSWLARTPEHAVVSRSMTRLRIVNSLLAASLLSAAAAISIEWQPAMWNALWILSYVLCGLALVLVVVPAAIHVGRKILDRTKRNAERILGVKSVKSSRRSSGGRPSKGPRRGLNDDE